jgi:ABC-type protease/lipase transport system fused ATPase/permease subunit
MKKITHQLKKVKKGIIKVSSFLGQYKRDLIDGYHWYRQKSQDKHDTPSLSENSSAVSNVSAISVHAVLSTCQKMMKYMLFFGAICNLLLLSSTIYVMQVLDRVLSSGSYETLWMLTIITLLALLLLATIQGGRVWLLSKVAQWLEKQLSGTLFASSIIPLSDKSAQSANRSLLSSLHTLKNYLTSPAFIAVIDLPWALLFIVVLFILHVYIGWLTVFGALVLILVAIISHRTSKPLAERYQKRANDSAAFLSQAQHNHDSLQTMGGMGEIQQDWQRLNEETQAAQLKLAKRQTMMGEMSKFFRLTLQIFVTGLGAYLVLINEFTAGAIIASSALVGRALQPIEVTINGWKNLIAALHAYRQLKSHRGDLITHTDNTRDVNDTNNLKNIDTRGARGLKGATQTNGTNVKDALSPFQGNLQVQKLYYGLQRGDQLPILQNINFTLTAGHTLVIMGHNGVGKSTLAKILAGLVKPEMGQVLWGNHALTDWDNQQLGQYRGYLPQTVNLFKAPLWRNIARMALVYDEQKVMTAAKMIGADRWITELSQGYHTDIDPQQLSAGQKQQLGLARAFYGLPSFLLLDEPSHFLDDQAQHFLANAIQTVKVGKTPRAEKTDKAEKTEKMTTVIISHDMQLVQQADELLILNKGQQLLYGQRDQVLQTLREQQGKP